jgi:hypothetical protein
MDFSLGVRKLDFGFRVWKRSDYPRDVKPGEALATTTDALGNRVDYALFETPAENLRTVGGGPWVSEPQPTERAAVRLYADVRASNNGPRVVDRIYIDPIFTGSRLNVYWSDGEVAVNDERWEALDDPLDVPVATTLGTVDFSETNGMVVTSAERSSVVFDNNLLGWEANEDWSVSFDVRLPRQDGPSAGGNTQVLWGMSQAETSAYLGTGPFSNSLSNQLGNTATPSLTLFTNANEIILYYTYDDKFIARSITLRPVISNEIDRVNLFEDTSASLYWNSKEKEFTLSAYNKRSNTLIEGSTKDGVNGVLVFLSGGVNQISQSSQEVVSDLSMFQPKTMFIGSADIDARRGATISHFGLFTGARARQAVEDFRNDPRNTVVKDRFAKREGDRSDNAVIRFAREWANEGSIVYGFRGGYGHSYDSLVWNPVPRDFRAERGNLYLPSISAKYFCLEFTDLTPTPYEQMSKQDNRVEVMPSYLYDRPSEGESDVHAMLPGTKWAIGQQGFVSEVPYNPAAEGMYALDPERKIQLSSDNLLMGVHKPYGSTPLSSVRFDDVGPHRYSEMVVNQEQRIAYFAGLNQLEFSRSILDVRDDTPVYQESYADLAFVDSITMRHRPGMIDSTNGPGVSVTSKAFRSRSRVQGVQFATHQSPSVQVIPNDNFGDPALLTADSDGLVVESITLSGTTPVNLAMRDVFLESVKVTSSDGEVVYVEEDDYTLDPAEGLSGVTQITRVVSGDIASGDEVLVYYEHDVPGWQRLGMATLQPQPERFRVLIERDVSPELFWRSPDGNIVQRVVNPVFASRKGPGLSGDESLGGIVSPLVAVTRKGNIEAAVRVTMRSELRGGPLKLQILGAGGDVVASKELRTGYAGETYEWTVMANAQMFTNVTPNFGGQTLIDHPVYPIRPADTTESTDDYIRSRWPLVDISGGSDAPFTGVRVRLVQEGASNDGWYVDQLSLYDESIFWEFSPGNDEWIPAIGDIRNNANGIVRFPSPTARWRARATAMRSNLYITGWQVRPWYVSKSPVQFLPQFRGATASLYDQFPPIEDDPMYQQWTSVVPRSWYLNSQSVPEASIFGQPLLGGWSRRWKSGAGVSVAATSAAGALSVDRVRFGDVDVSGPVVEATVEVTGPEDE